MNDIYPQPKIKAISCSNYIIFDSLLIVNLSKDQQYTSLLL